jgi:tetratricopeptide (TPR) repeat protein
MIRFLPPRFSARLASVVLALVAGTRLHAEPENAAVETHQTTEPLSASHPSESAGPTSPAATVENPIPAADAEQKRSAVPAEKVTPAPATKPKAPPAEAAHGHAPAPALAAHTPPPARGAPKSVAAAPLPGSEIQKMLKLGVAMTERGEYDAAEIAYRQILRSRGIALNDTKTALLGLAHMHRKQGSLTKAAAIFEYFLREYPEDERTPDALLELGRTIRALGTFNLAITRFYSVINSTLKLPAGGFEHYQLLAKTAQFEIAETYFDAGNYAEAAKFFTRLRLLDLAPADRARAHFKAAYSQHLQGLHAEAVVTLRAFLEQSPNDENIPEARYLLAITLRQLNRTQEALAVTLELLRTEQATVSTNPKLWAYWQRRTGNQLANDFFAAGNIVNAHAIYFGLAELSNEPAWRLPILYQMAICLERLGHDDRAIETYHTIVETAGSGPLPEVAEIVRMSTWRLSQLDWNNKTRRLVTSLFETTTGQATLASALPVAPKTAASP